MKKLNQHFLLAAAAMLLAGTAYAQAPTNTYQGQPIRQVTTPTNTHSANTEVTGASAGSYNKDYNAYSQDSYVSQAGSGNYATVDQVNTGGSNNRGGTAILNQNGDNNNAFQRQSAAGDPKYGSYDGVATARNLERATQNGSKSQVNQTQSGGVSNTMNILQGSATSGNRAIQTQSTDANGMSTGNQAGINQTHYQTAGGGSGNRAEQSQTGINHVAQIDQEASNSYAKQTQSGSVQGLNENNASIHQGDPGNANTAMQTQSGTRNVARIQQAVGSAASNNYALQNQTMDRNQADISQQSSNNYAEQQQSGMGTGGGNNYSSIAQSNVASAAYTVQSGNNNAVIVTQH